MAKHVSSILLVAFVLLALPKEDIRYYRSEDDFHRGIEITERQLGWKPYLEVHFDEDGNVVWKYRYRRKKKLIGAEFFHYDSLTGELRSKSVYDSDTTLVQRFIFGPGEEMSEKYIRYVYGVDQVQDFGDRFTEIKFGKAERPNVYRFFDVDAFLYGEMRFSYDDEGILRQEDWVAMPEDKVMRRFLYRLDAESQITEIWEYDSTLLQVNHIWVGAGGRAPLFTVESPTDSSSTNTVAISYSLLEALTEGRVIWEWQGGTPDPLAPYEAILTVEEMEKGDHEALILHGAPELVDGAVYRLKFSGTGISGYPAIDIELEHVTFDITPPDYTAFSHPAVSEPEVSFFFSEDLSRGELRWIWQGGELDTVSAHVLQLSGPLLEQGEHESISFESDVHLTDGSVYTIQFQGRDLAGNPGMLLSLPGIKFDVSRPVYTSARPDSGAYINSNLISYHVTEDLAQGELVWRQISGTADTLSPHVVPLLGDELGAGAHDQILLAYSPQLTDGAVYELEIRGVDLAGNMMDTVRIPAITYDVTLPVVEIKHPSDGQAINSSQVTYSLSEDMAAAEIDWSEVVYDTATITRRVDQLEGSFLTGGDHSLAEFGGQQELRDGATYRITIKGHDLAGNEAVPFDVTEVLYDVTPPVFSDVFPIDSSFINSREVSYTLSETLAEGIVIWAWVGGEADAGSPYIVNLSFEELEGGEHKMVLLSEGPALQDGAVYELSFMGMDRAGNSSASVIISQVKYDFTPPVVKVTYPPSASAVSDARLSYECSETLKEATVTWERVGGSADDGAPHLVQLMPDELQPGEHRQVELVNVPDLVEGATYDVVFEGWDLAGNPAALARINTIIYDTTPPEIFVALPKPNSFRNSTDVFYVLSELLVRGTVIWTQTGGMPDPMSPHIVEMEPDERTGGEHGAISLINGPILKDGSVYDIEFFGEDVAGNPSDTVIIANVTFDRTEPMFEITYPEPYSPVPSTAITYHLSEDLAEGTVTWKWTGGSADDVPEHIQPLSVAELERGRHERAILQSAPTLIEGAVYTVVFSGKDRAGNSAAVTQLPGIMFDATAPEFTHTWPGPNTAVNRTTVSYTLSENLREGRIIWRRLGGEPDPASPHRVELTGYELNAGAHEGIELGNAPLLQDGSVYTLSFVGADGAGNVSDTVTIEKVLYDVTSPLFQVSYPASNTWVPNSMLSYSLSEDLAQAKVTWEWESGAPDSRAPHVRALTAGELLAGEHGETNLVVSPALVEGAVYTITFRGRDRAGNITDPVRIVNVGFDATRPVISQVYPQDSSFVNHSRIAYALSETLERGQIKWTRIGGMDDSGSPHSVALENDELNAGYHPLAELTNGRTLQDGAVYELEFIAEDAAGNMADTVRIKNITYDITSPQLVVTFPQSDSYVRAVAVSYSLSEEITEGTATWQRVGGVPDESAPHIATLSGAELQAGDHPQIELADSPDLVDGAIYTLTFEGRDRASNEAAPAMIERFYYDATPPMISDVFPEGGMFVNHDRLSYRLSEDLAQGTVTWTRVAGNLDTSSPHVSVLRSEELAAGVHRDISVADAPVLHDGTIYTLVFSGVDPAGNTSDTLLVERVVYDTTRPEFAVTYPEPGRYVSDLRMVYHLSEEIAKGTVTWKWTGGTADAGAPHIKELAETERMSGEHDGELMDSPHLVDGAVYSLVFDGQDKAGNNAKTVQIPDVTYDASPPAFTVVFPQPETFINEPRVSYTLSENIESGSIAWIRVAGAPDAGSPHVAVFAEDELTAADHSAVILHDSPELKDGTVYRITFAGVDVAGNLSDTVEVNNVTYDVTPPVVTIDSPVSGDFVKKVAISYSLSEQLLEGRIMWVRTSGPPDPASPYTASLGNSELQAGQHAGVILRQTPTLTDAVAYSISFFGIDRAGNASDTARIEAVTFDAMSPIITVQSPGSSSFRNHSRLTYTLSESLAVATVTWRQMGGAPDAKSPHVLKLVGKELSAGDHRDILLQEPVELNDGTVYVLEFKGRDLAGNESNIVEASEVHYDTTSPIYTILTPAEEAHVNSNVVSYTLSEDLVKASLTWDRVGGVEDPASPHVVDLMATELHGGEHRDVTLVQAPSLMNGSLYELVLRGTDLAGNEGEAVSASNILFDDEAPVMAVESPSQGDHIKDAVLTYSFSEELRSARITWTQTGGTQDPGSPHMSALSGVELGAGEHYGTRLISSPTLQDGSVYRIRLEGEDLAGNEAEPIVVTDLNYDIMPPVITILFPESHSQINTVEVGYVLSEDLDSAKVMWEWTGGLEDNSSPHISYLLGNERQGGEHRLLLGQSPELVNGAVYRVSFSGLDRAGNPAQPATVEEATFDISPPVIVANYPAPSSTVNTSMLSYSLSETMAEGSVTWTWVDGSPDPNSPHIQPLVGIELGSGDHENIELSSPPQLVNGAVYSIRFEGSDAAGNGASGMVIESVRFDNEKPQLTLELPDSKRSINEPRISYSLSESLSHGRIVWARESGQEDPNAPHGVELVEQELTGREHSSILLTNSPELKDGTVYSITLDGADFGGNEAEPVSLTGVVFDTTSPVVTVTMPASNAFTNKISISCDLSERLQAASATWIQTGGEFDPGSPHEVPLVGVELEPGEHNDIVLANQPPLVDGSVYTLTLSGRDLAGNLMREMKIEGIQYDSSPPEISQVSPVGGSFVNSAEIGYTLSETLAEGWVIWGRVGGADDPDSPHRVELAGEELAAGAHSGILLKNSPILATGASYALTVEGIDRAGNSSSPVEVAPIVYDDTPPGIAVSLPDSFSFVNHSRISYELTESLSSGAVSWIPEGGSAPETVLLSGSELEKGFHEGVVLKTPPKLSDGGIYDVRFEGVDLAGNEALPVVVPQITYDVTVPRMALQAPESHSVIKERVIAFTTSEELSAATVTWVRESGVADQGSPHILPLPAEHLSQGSHSDVIVPGVESVRVGTIYTLSIRGWDLAGNESKRDRVQGIDMIRDLTGEWLYKGALLTAVWRFSAESGFLQGVMMGTRISNEEPGTYSVDFSKKPFELTIVFESGVKRYAIFEFTGPNSMRVVVSQKRPDSWSDGDLMEFEYNETAVP